MRRGWFIGAAWEACSPQGQPMWSWHLCSGNDVKTSRRENNRDRESLAACIQQQLWTRMSCACLLFKRRWSRGQGAYLFVCLWRSHGVMPLRAAVPIPIPYLGSWHWSVVLLDFKANLYYLHSVFFHKKKKKKEKMPPEIPLLDIVQRCHL